MNSATIQNYILDVLRSFPLLATLANAGQIRAQSDQSAPKIEGLAIVVAVTDKGNHLGVPGRILVDFDVEVSIRSSLTDDPDLTGYNELAQSVQDALNGLPCDLVQSGFILRYFSPWQENGLALDGFFRYNTFTSTFLIQSL